MLKKCKLVMLPSNQKAPQINMITTTNEDKLQLVDKTLVDMYEFHKQFGDFAPVKPYQHLYILSDDEITEGCWFYADEYSKPEKATHVNNTFVNGFIKSACKKIIATTDISLKTEIFGLGETAMCSLPQPSQSFLEVFVKEYNKGNVIKEVMIEYDVITLNEDWSQKPVVITNEYKLKINSKDNTITIKRVKDSWNREEVIALFKKYIEDKENSITSKYNGFDNWIEQNL